MNFAKYISGFALIVTVMFVTLVTVGEVAKQSEAEGSSASVSASVVTNTIETTNITETTTKVNSGANKTVNQKNKTEKYSNTKSSVEITVATKKKNKYFKKADCKSEYEVPNLPDFKSWTNYHCVSRNSPQWKVLTGNNTYTDDNGFRRKGDDYLVAMGSYYTKTLGDRFRITTSKGNVFTVTICDWKADCDTDNKGQYTLDNNCMIEFYVDDNLCNVVKNSGSCSSINRLNGKIIKIEKIK